ncbi:hypothetical protein DMH18_17970 [Streptomyces sp. WAC 06783]|uniref:hypothetical protein n=1 Tax=unclassified Streptomyces TaxID=2593676 RepID=UPI000F746A33|nr:MULTISPECIES: hypothetical protein [unclassified Streptomyces]RSO09315.1 hypothetical protein DMH18_17970 [Streptomyces sp. WAC 06783]RSO47762.1 hypothetical protein DMH15_05725 [Streptomyces sp. WAC 06725]
MTSHLTTRLEDGGRVLVVTSEPPLDTGATDRAALVYTLSVRARPNAVRSTYEDGQAVLERVRPVPLSGQVL